jgi:hypothetical protein
VSAAAVKTARAAQGKCDVRAPFPAIVLERLAQEGEMAIRQARPWSACSILRASKSKPRCSKQMQPVSRSARLLPHWSPVDGRYPLRLVRMSPALNKSSRLDEARLRFTAKAAAPGSSGRVIWASPEMHVPAQATGASARATGGFRCAGQDRAHFHVSARCPGRSIGSGGNGIVGRQPDRGSRHGRVVNMFQVAEAGRMHCSTASVQQAAPSLGRLECASTKP